MRVLVFLCVWEKIKTGIFAIPIEQLMAVDFMVLLIDCYSLLLVVCLVMVVYCSYMYYHIYGPVRFAEKTSRNIVPADLLREKNTVSAEKDGL